jgi:hypothetical protein
VDHRLVGRIIRNRQNTRFMPGLDVRGDGGYVLAPPSIHPSGRVYSWSVDSGNCFEDAPGWLVDLIAKDRGHQHVAASPEQWRSFLDTTVDGSRRGSAIARAYGLLVHKYVDHVIAFGFVQLFNELRCQPPLDFEEIEKIAAEIHRLEAEQVRNKP